MGNKRLTFARAKCCIFRQICRTLPKRSRTVSTWTSPTRPDRIGSTAPIATCAKPEPEIACWPIWISCDSGTRLSCFSRLQDFGHKRQTRESGTTAKLRGPWVKAKQLSFQLCRNVETSQVSFFSQWNRALRDRSLENYRF